MGAGVGIDTSAIHHADARVVPVLPEPVGLSQELGPGVVQIQRGAHRFHPLSATLLMLRVLCNPVNRRRRRTFIGRTVVRAIARLGINSARRASPPHQREQSASLTGTPQTNWNYT